MKLDNSTDGQHTDSRQRGKKTETRQLHMDMMKLDNSTNGHVESRQRRERTTLKLDNSTDGHVESRQRRKIRGQHWNWTTVWTDTLKADSVERGTGQQYKWTTCWKQTTWKAVRTGRGQQWNTATCWKRPVLYTDDTEGRLSFNAWDISGTKLVLFKVFTLTSLTAKRLED